MQKIIVKEMSTIKELELKQFLKLFWDKKIFIIIVVILFGIIGWAKIEYLTTPMYTAEGKLICGRTEESRLEGNTVTASEITMPSSLAETYAELIKSDLIVNKVIENLHLNMSTGALRSSVTLTPLTKVYYTISVKNSDAELAADLVNEFIDVFSEEIRNFYEIDNIQVVDAAKIPTSATNMNMKKSVTMFAGIGFVVAAGCIMIMFIFNNTVTNSDQIKRYTKLQTLASIPKYSGDEDLITLRDSKSPYAESIKILRTNLQYMYEGAELQTVAITSSLPGEGKSWLSANLAVAFANTGKRTLIIDADMRRGRQHRLFRVKKMPGLSEFLRSTRESSDMISVSGRRVAKGGLAKSLAFINKFIKIEKIQAVSNIIYKDDFLSMEIDNKAKTRRKSLKKDVSEKEVEIKIEPKKKKATSKSKQTSKKERTITKVKKVEDLLKEDVEKSIIKENTPKDEEPSIFEFVRRTKIENLYLLPSGSERLESSELLSKSKFKQALEELQDEFDMIVIDTPPVSVVADGFIISRIVDTNIIVLKHGNTEINELNKIKNNIQEIGGEVIGTVINKIPDANKKYYNTYYNKKS